MEKKRNSLLRGGPDSIPIIRGLALIDQIAIWVFSSSIVTQLLPTSNMSILLPAPRDCEFLFCLLIFTIFWRARTLMFDDPYCVFSTSAKIRRAPSRGRFGDNFGSLLVTFWPPKPLKNTSWSTSNKHVAYGVVFLIFLSISGTLWAPLGGAIFTKNE